MQQDDDDHDDDDHNDGDDHNDDADDDDANDDIVMMYDVHHRISTMKCVTPLNVSSSCPS